MKTYIKPLVDEFESTYYHIRFDGDVVFGRPLTRVELEQFIEAAEEALKKGDSMLKAREEK